jgi:hypothetical protein
MEADAFVWRPYALDCQIFLEASTIYSSFLDGMMERLICAVTKTDQAEEYR